VKQFLAVATRVGTPLALGGLIIGVFFLIVRLVISAGLIPQVTVESGGTILLRIINGFIILSLVAVVLGFLGFWLRIRYPKINPNYVNFTSPQEYSLSQLVAVIAAKRNVTINFNSNCDESVRKARIEPGNHEGRDMKHLLESLKQRVKGQSISYAVKKEDDKRYEIVCK
jgi:hypothetical protein